MRYFCVLLCLVIVSFAEEAEKEKDNEFVMEIPHGESEIFTFGPGHGRTDSLLLSGSYYYQTEILPHCCPSLLCIVMLSKWIVYLILKLK